MANANERESEQATLGIDRAADVIVVGGGLAGLAGALTLVRARRSVLVVDGGHPRNAPAAHVHGYLTRDGVSPLELLAAGRAEVARYGGEIMACTATSLARLPSGGFGLTLADGTIRRARQVLVATGLVDEYPDIPGLRDRCGLTSCTARSVSAGNCVTDPWQFWPPVRMQLRRPSRGGSGVMTSFSSSIPHPPLPASKSSNSRLVASTLSRAR
jgi:Pyridine nucleotide-disulphide oxidoreductase